LIRRAAAIFLLLAAPAWAQDEGEGLITGRNPDPQLVSVVPVSPSDSVLSVTGLDGRVSSLTSADLADLPRAKAGLRSGVKATAYEGVLLSAVLKVAGVPSGPRLHGKPVASVVVITAADGYRVVLSLPEADASFRDGAIILADRKASGPLDANEGPFRLVIDADKRPERSIRQVRSIKVVPAP
jgi:hypothetical protein